MTQESRLVKVSKGSAAWGQRLRRQIAELNKSFDKGYMQMAKLLYTAWDTPIDGDRNKAPIFTLWGYDTFADYVTNELGMDRRKGERLRLLYYKLFVELAGLDEALLRRIENLGYTKCREITRVITATNIEKWVETAETSSCAELTMSINRYLEEYEREAARVRSNSEMGGSSAAVDEIVPEPIPTVERTLPLHFALVVPPRICIGNRVPGAFGLALVLSSLRRSLCGLL